jgi:hypothetical protein
VNLAAVMRLRGAIGSSLNSIPTDQAAVAGHAMTDGYARCRSEVRAVIADATRPEFDRLFPEMRASGRGIGVAAAAQFNEARGHLGRLDGWLEGQIDYRKFERQAELEAEAKVEAELRKTHTIGFKPSIPPTGNGFLCTRMTGNLPS